LFDSGRSDALRSHVIPDLHSRTSKVIIGSDGSLVKSEVCNAAIAPPDPRLEAFTQLLRAVDRRSWPDGQLATRRLRQLGFSVCLIKPTGDRGPA
jgi:hypothetical protein